MLKRGGPKLFPFLRFNELTPALRNAIFLRQKQTRNSADCTNDIGRVKEKQIQQHFEAAAQQGSAHVSTLAFFTTAQHGLILEESDRHRKNSSRINPNSVTPVSPGLLPFDLTRERASISNEAKKRPCPFIPETKSYPECFTLPDFYVRAKLNV